MLRRRYSNPTDTRVVAPELAVPLTKTVELENRIARLEVLLRKMAENLDDIATRQARLQAELDRLAARFSLLAF